MNFKQSYFLFKSYIDYNKYTFLRQMKPGKLLDIGCGNHSPTRTKELNSSIYYVGVDIDNYNIDNNDMTVSDEIHFFDVATFFPDIINKIPHQFDYIVCAHVIEHLPDQDLLFKTIKNKLTKGGQCFLTTPDINSINFPSAKGTLNYYDDTTHVAMPVTFQKIYDLCLKHDLRLTRFKLGNRSTLSYILGFLMEPFRMLLKRALPFTWAYWGFEDMYIIKNL